MANPAAEPRKRAPGLYTIIVIKLGKGLLVFCLALGAYSLLGEDLGAEFGRFLRWLKVDPEHEFFAELGRKIQRITPDNVRWVAWGTFLYGLLLFVEGVGLMFRAWWAGWLAIGETAFFIPIEVYDLIRGFSLTVLVILIINLAIVGYLVRNRNRLFHHHYRRQEN